ncbi:MAG: hypothetical protein QM650_17055 [Microlunatus sp.]
MTRSTGSPTTRRAVVARRSPWGRARRIIAVLAALVLAILAFGPAPMASAGTLNLAVTPIDTSDSSTITSIADGEHSNRITYQVQFSCQASACTNTEVKFSPSQPDPHGLLPAGRYLLSYESWVPPVGGDAGDISGTDQTGKAVDLGNLTAGQSGTFSLTYAIPGDTYRQVPYGSFYPDGFEIEMAATMSSSNSTSVTANASSVTWGVELPPATFPGIGIAVPTSSKPDTDVSYRLTMGAGNMIVDNQLLKGDASWSAVGNYKVVYHLPAEAEFVSAELGGVYDSAAHTVTWQQGTLANPVYGARGGWGVNQTNGGFYGGGAGLDNPAGSALGDDDYAYFYQRGVVLNFPASNFPAADATGCNFSATVSSSMEVTVGYLDSARTVRSASVDRTAQVACWDAFVGVGVQKYVDNSSAYVNPVYMVNIPPPGNSALESAYWYVQIANRGNIPAVAVIDEPNLSQDDLEVNSIWPSGITATFEWTRSDGVSGTTVRNHNQVLTAPGNTYFTSVKATTAEIAPGRVQPGDTTQTLIYIDYRFRVKDDAPLGERRTNTANVSVSYPGYTGPIKNTSGTLVNLPIAQTVSRTIQFSQPSPAMTAAFSAAPVVNGPALTPGTEVTYTATGATAQIWPGTTIRPQYVYAAPVGWTVAPGSASLAADAPAGVTYDYRTAVIGGVSRSIVVATWPSAISPPNAAQTWPQLTVRATPTATAPTGHNAATALVWVGDASGNLSDAIGSQAYATASNQFRAYAATAVDAGDTDTDGNTTEEFAQATSAALTVAGSSGLQLVKELCIPDTSAPDGCSWTADTSSPQLVAVNAADITYRLTVTNGGSSALTNVVAYDVLPYVGDTSLTADATPRGSEFGTTIASVRSVSAGVTMAYSASTNPARPEVYPGAQGTVDDWNTDPSGKKAARMTVASLPAGQSRSVVVVAATDGTGAADEKVCNSAAIDSAQTLPTEPAAVCVTLAEADLAVELLTFDRLQAGRPTTLAYTVTNLGGSAEAPAAVKIEVPDGLSVRDLDVDGWDCAIEAGGTVPVSGPATLNCAPVDDTSQPRLLLRGQTEVLSFPVVVEDDEGELCTSANATGAFFDPDLGNNTDAGCRQISSPPAGLVIAKTDGLTTTRIGAEYTYTITVTNTLLAESVADIEVTDTLPDSLELVSADGSADVSGQKLTWTVDELAPLASVERHVTVKVRGSADSPVVNEASVTADDPGFPGEKLTDSNEDSDALLKLKVDKTSDARGSGVREGDVITYTVTVSGDPAGDYPGATITDDLTDVLDEATFVAGSASLSIDGGAAQPVTDPAAGLLTWTGTIPAGADAVFTYQVRVEEPDNGRLRNTVSTAPTPTDCDTATRLDENGMACAVLSTPFAPTITKTVESLTQDDDGSWTIEYGIDVANPAPTDTEYDLSDDLAFGPGITVTSATVDPPGGITPETWSGTGDVVAGADLPAGDTHHYTVTVVADAGAVVGTAAATCSRGEALGFANTATLTLDDGFQQQTEACAEPAKPTVTKGLDGAPVQRDDGRWTVTYLITVANAAEQPDGGLTYRLEDTLDFPDGLTVDDLEVMPPAGVTANDEFTGGLTEIGGNAVTADSELIDGVARIPAATGGSPAVQEYRVQLIVSGAGAVDSTLLACGASGAGYGNWVSLLVGTVELGRATACADIRLPELEFTKTADSTSGTRPGDKITYTIVATNVGDADFTTGDPAELVDDMSELLDDAGYLEDATADRGSVVWSSPNLTWTGPLAAGETVKITYTAQVRDAGSGDGHIVNQVRLADIAKPVGDVPACENPSGGTGGVPACEVSLRVDNRSVPLPIPVPPNPPAPLPDSVSDSLADTGAAVPLGVLMAALLAIGVGLVLTLRGRKVN